MDWLNRYAAAITALAGIVTFLATAMLAYLTYIYVRLTAEIARANERMAETARQQALSEQALRLEIRQRKALALKELSRRLRVTLRFFDPLVLDWQKMKHFGFLSEGDIVAVESLAPEVGTEAILQSSLAVLALRLIRDLITKAQSVAREEWRPGPQEQEDWKGSLETVREALPKLEASCDQIVAQKG